MNYYISKLIKRNQYELLDMFNTNEEAEIAFNKLSEKNKIASKVVSIPEIKDGLILYRNGKYYRTIIGMSEFVYFLQEDINDKNEIVDPVMKENLIKWFIEEKIDAIEKYNKDLKFQNVEDTLNKNDIDNARNDVVKESEDN